MTIYNTNVDLVNDNVQTKYGLILLFHSQDIDQKLNCEVNQHCFKFVKNDDLQYQHRICQ